LTKSTFWKYSVFSNTTEKNGTSIRQNKKIQYLVNGKIYIFLDEVQNISNWESFVNSYSQDFTREIELFITGSNSNLLSGELATLLSGRYIEFEIHPFSFFEFAGIKSLPVNKETFLKYLQSGGLPEMFHFNSEELNRNYSESLKNTIVLRDIVERHNIKDIQLSFTGQRGIISGGNKSSEENANIS